MGMTNFYVILTIHDLLKSCPWLKTCLRRMDVTNIGDLHELTYIIIKKELV